MPRANRRGLSKAEKRELWQRWKAGQGLSEIGRALNRHAGSVHGFLSTSGGIEPRYRKRSLRNLQMSEREEISRALGQGFSYRHIARLIHRSASTISREVTKNGGRHRYRAVKADEWSQVKSLRPQPCKLASLIELKRIIANKLMLEWSPAQISGWLRLKYANN